MTSSTGDGTQAHYGRLAASYDENWAYSPAYIAWMTSCILDRAAIGPGQVAADVGCGTGLLEEDVPHPYGIHGILEDRGHAMATYTESVTSRPASADEERHLRLRPGIWVLDVWHTSFDQDGTPYELTRFVMRADMTGLDFTMTVS